MTPFILKGAIKILDEDAPTQEQVYDSQVQLWIDIRTGMPIVSVTVVTIVSGFDKESIDQSEATAFYASPFGETLHTATVESVDNPEIVIAQQVDDDAAYSHF